MSTPGLIFIKFLFLAVGALLLQACSTADTSEELPAEVAAADAEMRGEKPAHEAGTDIRTQAYTPPKISMSEWSLLEMRYEEARAISAQTAEVGPLFKVAADKIDVLKADKDGKPIKVRATGHVFLEMGLADRATALCGEAVVSIDEAVLKEKPMLMQASRIAKATADSTSFRITDHLKVSGEHEFIRPEELMQAILAAADEHGNIATGNPEPVVASQAQAQ